MSLAARATSASACATSSCLVSTAIAGWWARRESRSATSMGEVAVDGGAASGSFAGDPTQRASIVFAVRTSRSFCAMRSSIIATAARAMMTSPWLPRPPR